MNVSGKSLAVAVAALSTLVASTPMATAKESRFDIGSFILVVNMMQGSASSGIAFTGNENDSALAIKCHDHALSVELVSKGKKDFDTQDLKILFRADNGPFSPLRGGVFDGEIHAVTESLEAVNSMRGAQNAYVQVLSGNTFVTLTFPLQKADQIIDILTKTCALTK